MKRSQIRAGVVYGMQRQHGSGTGPVVFLEDAGARVWTERKFGGLAYTPSDEKPGRDRLYGDRGYAVVRPPYSANAAEALAALRAVDPAAELARFAAVPRNSREQGPASDLLEFDVLVSLGRVEGEYGEVIARHEAARRAAVERREAADRRSREQSARADDLAAGFKGLGMYAAKDHSALGGVRLAFSLDDAEQLLAALRAAR